MPGRGGSAVFLLWSLPALLLWCPGCRSGIQQPASEVSGASSSTREVIDLSGRTVQVPRTINRFILMRGMGLYDLAALLGDEIEEKLVGWDSSLQKSDRDAYDRFIERFPRLKQVPMLGDSLREGVSAEALLALRPDVVIGGSSQSAQPQTMELLERAGIPVLHLSSDDPLRDPQRNVLLLGKVFDLDERAKEITDWVDGELSRVQVRMGQLQGKVPSIYVEVGMYGAEKYGNTFGSNLQKQRVHWGSLLSQLRCQNLGENISGPFGMGVIQPESLLKRNPDVIVITGACWTEFPESLHLGYGADPESARQTLRQYLTRPGWSELMAVQAEKVYGLNTRLGAHLMSFVALQQLAQWLYPEEFKDFDPQQRMQEFHDRFMPIGLSGTWMVELKEP
ncbi:ABC transporter substrate-binding protein [Planctomicrobium sp. SH661]|uniref:ABC transporter substrate-binding protein n=1 Tax=Planctomicrobium sp. SH661 TaxID=3448124 RepID=UPI003F5B258F